MIKIGSLLLVLLLFISCGLKNEKSEQISTTEDQMKELIAILSSDSKPHKEIGPKLSDSEIQEVENALELELPPSYKIFLKEFGNGAYWLYMNAIDDVKQKNFLNKYRKDLGKTIHLVGGKEYEVDSLLCLMTEDSNGGAWVWLTSENSESGEWPLAYYSLSDKKLHYKVDNFIEWLRLLTKGKYEVIRELDLDGKLGLG
ncbi:SMI1/KNR4 family protein [Sediminicola sp. YIK13]|uniref:SMI1/KNR4 family protein n=1 Tax=Sediminicola sp. YIK13 TaxID=1453352 RepID=UPI000782793B|nr:SMI1/KNR4 family protein [Sediminicola sp. YIK13]